MLEERIAGYCIVDKKGTPNGTRNPEKYLTGRRLRVMEFAEDGGAMVYAPDGTEIAMIEACDVTHKFKCVVIGDYLLPENLKDDMMAQTLYIARIETRKGGYAPILKEMIIAASLHRGYFTDNVLWAKQNEEDAVERQKQARVYMSERARVPPKQFLSRNLNLLKEDRLLQGQLPFG